jgi:predicted ATPase
VVVQPSGTVTLVFTDVEGSTRLLRELGRDAYQAALGRQRGIVRAAFARHAGYEVDTAGDGFFYAFASASEALAAIEEAMAGLEETQIRIRVGVHTGEPGLDPPSYVGVEVHLAARIMSAGHGGQVLLSQATCELLDGEVLRDLGEYRLKDFDEPVQLFQLGTVDFPPLKTISNTNLPRPASSFVGRQRERGEVVELLGNGARLVTLAGPGGSGKTRLAIEAASELVPSFKAGVFWVGLAQLRDPALVPEEIAQTLGARGDLAEHVGERELLLLLDNFEQVMEATPSLSALLERCPHLKLLVTSRELLRIQGEVEYPVPPLAESEAVELFCARAQLEPNETIAELCRRLDELPLAVELAAARTSVLAPAQILERISQRLDLLRGGRDADPRQQTLRATIEWSCELLSEPEKQLFGRLSVFAGGCTLGAAEEIVGADVDTLQSLVDKSLVRHTSDRFWMLETIGELAGERLADSDEAEEVRRRHASYFLALAERAAPALKGADQPATLARLKAEHDNLRASLDRFFDDHEPELAVTLAGELWLFWCLHGHVTEGRRWLRRALEVAPDQPTEARATVLEGAGCLAHEQGDEAEANRLLEASLSCAKQVGAVSAAASAAAHLCGVLNMSDPRAAVTAGEGAVGLARKAGDDYVLAVALNNLGHATALLGENERSTAYFEESLELRRRIGDMSGVALSLTNLAGGVFEEGDTTRATAMLVEAAEIATAVGNKRQLSAAVGALGWFAYTEERWDEAEAQARESLRLGREIDMTLIVLTQIACLAGIAAATGELVRAARLAAAEEFHRAIFAPATLTEVTGHHAKIESAKAGCDPAIWERASAEGRAMSLDEAADYALSG